MIPALHMLAEIGMLVARDIPQIYLSRRAKVRTKRSCRGIERDQTGIERRFEDTAFAGSVRYSRWVEPRCCASIDETIPVVECLVDPGIVGPELLASHRIKRDDTVEGCR